MNCAPQTASFGRKKVIKGVNKQIIEVHDTGSSCFEKAILFIRPEFSGANDKFLKTEAHRVIREYDFSGRVKKKRRRPVFIRPAAYCFAAAVGALLCWIFARVI